MNASLKSKLGPVLPDDAPDELRQFLAGEHSGAMVVKLNRKRTVIALSPAEGEPPSVYVKLDHPVRAVDHLKSRISPKVKREYRTLERLRDLGLPVVEPLCFACNGGYGLLATRALPDAVEATDFWRRHADDPARRWDLLMAIADFLRLLYERQVWHPDLHTGNLLVRQDASGELSLTLVDVHGVHPVRRISERGMLHMMRVFDEARDVLSPAEGQRLVLAARPGLSPTAADDAWRELGRIRAAHYAKRWPGHRKKLLRNSSFCVVSERPDGVVYMAPDMDLETVVAAVAVHDAVTAGTTSEHGHGELLKRATKRDVVRVDIDAGAYVVKKFKKPGPWGRFAADQRSWMAHRRLELADLPVAPALAWYRREDGSAFIITPFVEGPNLHDAMAAADTAEREQLVQAALALLHRLYSWRIVHADLKTENMIVQPRGDAPPELILVDNDAVLFDQTIGPDESARNRRHLIGSLPDEPGLADWVGERFDREFCW